MMSIDVIDHEFDFSPIKTRMQSYIDKGLLSCVSTVILKGTDVLDVQNLGFQDIEEGIALPEDAIFRVYSNTKIVTSVALMQLYEVGRFKLEDPLEKYLPEFADMQVLNAGATNAEDCKNVEQKILIKHILSHSAGFSYGHFEPDSVIDQLYTEQGIGALVHEGGGDLEELCKRVGALPLAYEPGTFWRYSVATDICARLVEVLSGQKFDAYLKQRIFEPLQMVDTDFWVPEDKVHRFTTLYAPTNLMEPMNTELVKMDDAVRGSFNRPAQFLSGGGGLVSTLEDYLNFIRMIINGGQWFGQRVIRAETLDLMRTNQLAEGVGVNFMGWQMPGTVFGLGFALKAQLTDADPEASQDEYHWGGIAGTHSWMAPHSGISGMCFTQRMPGFMHPFSFEFKAMVYAAGVSSS
ncbi:MAG: beta-lactamase family protein [Gammaproteobacteria bacterium]|nr:beta-lactamase family protein [Gammaproteobacteria bacterium]